MISFQKFFEKYDPLVLEYRHNMADGTPKLSIKPDNGKDPNRMGKKKMTTDGPYNPVSDELHTPGTLLIGDKLLGILANYNIDFEDGKVAKVKNSPMGMQMFLNPQNLPAARIIKLQ